MSTLQVSVSAGRDGPVMVLSGEADMTSLTVLNDALAAAIPHGARHLTVDTSGLQFADSASVRALVLAALTLKDRGGFLVLLHPQPALTHVLTLLGADQVITLRPAPAPDRRDHEWPPSTRQGG